jgi:hypothetical protein
MGYFADQKQAPEAHWLRNKTAHRRDGLLDGRSSHEAAGVAIWQAAAKHDRH